MTLDMISEIGVYNMIDLIGFFAAVLTTVSTLPQALKVYQTNRTRDLSKNTYILLTAGKVIWFIYAVMRIDLPLGIANFISALILGYITCKIYQNLNDSDKAVNRLLNDAIIPIVKAA